MYFISPHSASYPPQNNDINCSTENQRGELTRELQTGGGILFWCTLNSLCPLTGEDKFAEFAGLDACVHLHCATSHLNMGNKSL